MFDIATVWIEAFTQVRLLNHALLHVTFWDTFEAHTIDEVLTPEVVMLLVVNTVQVTLEAMALLHKKDGALTVTADD